MKYILVSLFPISVIILCAWAYVRLCFEKDVRKRVARDLFNGAAATVLGAGFIGLVCWLTSLLAGAIGI
jgi:predicted permease